MEENIVNIEDLIQDKKNFNLGTKEGQKLIEKSFNEFGAGRSVLVDKYGCIIAGNKSQEAAISAGIKKVRVIETTGDVLVAVKRTDIDLNSEIGRKMALADNSTSKENIAWSKDNLEDIRCQYEDFEFEEWGVDVDDDFIPDDFFIEDDSDKKEDKLHIKIHISHEFNDDIPVITEKIKSVLKEFNGVKVRL